MRLHLSHNRITDNGAEQLADALRQNKVIDDVLLHFCLSYMLFFLQTLAKLYLSNTEIGDDGAQYLANALLQTQVIIILIYLVSILFFLFFFKVTYHANALYKKNNQDRSTISSQRSTKQHSNLYQSIEHLLH